VRLGCEGADSALGQYGDNNESSSASSGLILGMINPSVAPYKVDTGFTSAATGAAAANIEYQIFTAAPSGVKIGSNGGNAVSAVLGDIWD
jgi:hypothetical protein